MVEYRIRFDADRRLTRIPKVLAQAFGTSWIVRPNSASAIIFPENADLVRVLRSLAILRQELENDLEFAGHKKAAKAE